MKPLYIVCERDTRHFYRNVCERFAALCYCFFSFSFVALSFLLRIPMPRLMLICWCQPLPRFAVFFVKFDIFLPLSLPDFRRVVSAVCSFVCKCVAFFHHFNFTDETGVRYRAHIVTCIWWSMIENVLNRFSFVHEWLFLSLALALPQNGIMANTLHAYTQNRKKTDDIKTQAFSLTRWWKRDQFFWLLIFYVNIFCLRRARYLIFRFIFALCVSLMFINIICENMTPMHFL